MISSPPSTPPTLPKLCRLLEFGSLPGLFATPPSRRTVTRWKEDGIIIMRRVAGGEFVDVHATLRRLNIKP